MNTTVQLPKETSILLVVLVDKVIGKGLEYALYKPEDEQEHGVCDSPRHPATSA